MFPKLKHFTWCVAKYVAERYPRVMNGALQSDLLTIL